MTSDDYKTLASSNGYDLGAKTDAELLGDYSFHKAACSGMEEESSATLKGSGSCPSCGAAIQSALASFHTAARVRFNLALDAYDAGHDDAFAWTEVLSGAIKKSSLIDENGNIVYANLP